jgi:hypothetical protein
MAAEAGGVAAQSAREAGGDRLVRGAERLGAGPVEPVVLLAGQVEVERVEVLPELGRGARADDGDEGGRGTGGAAAPPRHRHLGRRGRRLRRDVAAVATRQAGKLDSPPWWIFPARVRSSKAVTISSTGVSVSGRWTQ